MLNTVNAATEPMSTSKHL